MKKTLLFLMVLAASALTLTAQNNVPRPLNPEISEWIDGTPYQWPDGSFSYNTQLGINWGLDVMGNLVADDYDFEFDEAWTEGPCQYTKLDPDKFSYSIFTDNDKIYTFTPDKYEEFSEPTTMVPFAIMLGPETGGTYPNFEYWYVHFVEETNNGEQFGLPRFFKWRIGVQTHYTVDGVTNSSDIVYYDLNKWGDLNDDGDVNVMDVTLLINMILGSEAKISLADLNDDNDVNVNDVTMLINRILGIVGDFGKPINNSEE